MNRFFRAVLAALLLVGATPVVAHEGHDHKDDKVKMPVRAAAPRAEAATPDFELVAVLEGARLVVYLDRYATNEPVAGAVVEIEQGGKPVRAAEIAPGVYTVEATWHSQPGRHALTFAVDASGNADLLTTQIDVVAPPEAAAAKTKRFDPWQLALAAAAFPIVGVFAWRFTRRKPAAAMLVAGALALVAAPPAPAHQGEDHDEKPKAAAGTSANGAAANGGGTAPARLADGSVFMPKPSQRSLGVRTLVAEPTSLSRSIELAGRVVPDPNAGGRVQASQSGRIEPGPKGLPLPGRVVARGEILAYVRPAVSSMDLAARKSALAELAGKKRLAEQQLERYQQLEGSVPQRRIDEARLELESVAKREAALAIGHEQREALVAPVAGVLSASHVVAGQMVEAKDVLFELVDPKRLMVEALGYNPALAKEAANATVTLAGETFSLEFAGAGWQLREQAVPLLFRVRQPAPALAVGQPLKVRLATRERIDAVRVPAQAVAGGAEPVVWVHREAERFVPRKVKVQPLESGHVAVISGLERGDRVVVEGAAALAQAR